MYNNINITVSSPKLTSAGGCPVSPQNDNVIPKSSLVHHSQLQQQSETVSLNLMTTLPTSNVTSNDDGSQDTQSLLPAAHITMTPDAGKKLTITNKVVRRGTSEAYLCCPNVTTDATDAATIPAYKKNSISGQQDRRLMLGSSIMQVRDTGQSTRVAEVSKLAGLKPLIPEEEALIGKGAVEKYGTKPFETIKSILEKGALAKGEKIIPDELEQKAQELASAAQEAVAFQAAMIEQLRRVTEIIKTVPQQKAYLETAFPEIKFEEGIARVSAAQQEAS